MKRYEVSVWFDPMTVYVSAKSESNAKKKAYLKIRKKGAKIIKKDTEVNS